MCIALKIDKIKCRYAFGVVILSMLARTFLRLFLSCLNPSIYTQSVILWMRSKQKIGSAKNTSNDVWNLCLIYLEIITRWTKKFATCKRIISTRPHRIVFFMFSVCLSSVIRHVSMILSSPLYLHSIKHSSDPHTRDFFLLIICFGVSALIFIFRDF